jgi:exosortase D (VPLPA-CTERM-specific)
MTQGHSPAVLRADVPRWHFSWLAWLVLAAALIVAFIPFANVLLGLFAVWNREPEYSHALLIPFISLFLIWREREALTSSAFRGSWSGVALVLLGVLMWMVAELSTIYVIAQYGFLIVLYGLVLALAGWRVFRRLWMPLLILLFIIPLPAFFSNSLSLRLQLLSSQLGVAVIRLAGISVYLDGNVIDLGTYKLQVAEACNGLRYLYPLMTLAFIVAYLFRAAPWKRLALFLSSIPIAVLMNSLRIGVIGITVEYWGPRMAEGVLHSFEGWVVFMISTLILLLLAAWLARVGQSRTSLREALVVDLGPSPARAPGSLQRTLPASFLAATALTALATALTFVLPERVELHPVRSAFANFPVTLGDWHGQASALEGIYREQLKLDDYLLADYRRVADAPVNVYIAYYDSQRKGQSTHSPRACLPGNGWEFVSFGKGWLRSSGAPQTVNRAVIEHGADQYLMYYWFQQRGRVLTNEYAVKWYIFWDALTRNRTDGAMVRLITPLPPGGEAAADRDLSEFAGLLDGQLSRYVPG